MSLSTLPPNNRDIAALTDASMAGEPVPVVSLRDIVRTIFRHAIPILLIIGLALSGAFGYLLLTGPTYTAYSKLLVRVGREKLAPLSIATEPLTNFVFNERVENTNDEMEILRNPHMMALVYPQLKARYQEMLAAAENQPPPTTLLEWARYIVRATRHGVSAGTHWVLDMAHEPLYFLGLSHRMSEDEMLGAVMQASLGVDFVKEANVIIVTFSWSEPTFAAYALNTFVEAYRREYLHLLNDLSGASQFYTTQATRTEAQLKTINHDVDQYLAQSGLTDPISEKQLAVTLITGLEHQLSDAQVAEQHTRQQRAAYQKEFDETSEWLETPGVPNVVLSGLADIDARYTDIMARRTALLSELKPGTRDVRDLDAQIVALRRTKFTSLTNYLNDRLASETSEQQVVTQRLAEQRARLEQLNVMTTHYVALLDQRDQVLAQLKTYRRQIEDMSVSQELNDKGFTSVVVLNPAVPPNAPSAPRKGLIMALALGFGVLFAAAYVILSEFFDHSFASERDVARVLGLRLVAMVPRVDAPAPANMRRRL